jgi:DNA polymerase-3 subunit beta
MKIQVTQENLNKALSSVGKVAGNHSTLPILSNILIKTIGNRVSISATNLDIAITHFIGSKVAEEGSITIPSRLTQDFISSLPPGIIDLELKDTKLNISTEKYKSTINGTSAEDYPDIPTIANGQKWEISSSLLKTTLQQVLFAASSDESRPILTGVSLYTKDGFLYCAATDSYRLAEKRVIKTKDDISLVIPASALQDLLRILDDSDDVISVTNDDQQILFEFNDVEMVARLIEGKYPDYSKLIPTEFAFSAVLLKSELTNTTKVASLFARENAGSVTVKLNPEEQTISVCSITSQVGENMSTTSAKVEGEGSITLNSRYIIDSLHALKGKSVKVSFNTKLEPCIITDPENDDYLHVIMPLKS